MEIAVAGAGYVGLVTGVCLAEYGHNVTCVDINKEKIDMMNNGISPIYEKDLEKLMIKNSDRLTYTTEYKRAYKNAQVIFIGVGTPEKKDGSANLKYVYEVAGQIAESIEQSCVVVIKSTVPIGTNDKIESFILSHLTHANKVCVVSNPEFLSQGTAVEDTLHAFRIIIGVQDSWAEKIMRTVYASFNVPIIVMDRKSAEMVKYASNDFLALKISYINEIANLCEIVGANIDDVAKGMGCDPRIGDRFLKAGVGYGGSCFPKDTKALHWLANFHDYEIKTIKAAIEVNENQKLKLLKKARKYYSDFAGLSVAVLGLTFKPGTDDLRESPSLINIPILLDEGANVKVYDPVALPKFEKLFFNQLTYCSTIEDAIRETDFCLIFTDWPEIKQFPIEKFKQLMRDPVIFDGRNCFNKKIFCNYGIHYYAIGVSNAFLEINKII